MSFFEKNVPGGHAVVGAHGDRADHGLAHGVQGGRDADLPGRRRPGHADLAGQPGRPRAARAPVDRGQQRPAPQRRPPGHRPRPRRAGRAARVLPGRAAGRATCSRSAGWWPSRSRAAARACTSTPTCRSGCPRRSRPRWPRRSPRRSQAQHPKLVTATMTKAKRPGKVFLDWSQNSRLEDHHLAVLAARARATDRGRAAHLGRGRGGRRGPRWRSSSCASRRCSSGWRSTATCSGEAPGPDPALVPTCYRTLAGVWSLRRPVRRTSI